MKATHTILVLGTILLALAGAHVLEAGSFKRVTIDGDFTDWAGVPVAFADDEDAPDGFDLRDIYVANDESYLYVRGTLFAPADYDAFHHQIVIDGDDNPGTGHPWVGVGSEMLVEDGTGYQQKNGDFNEGGVSGLDWATAPGGQITQFEARLSRSVLDAEGLPVFTEEYIGLGLQVLDLNWATVDLAPGILYEFAAKPPVATGDHALVELTTTTWTYDDVGDDWGTDWREPEFEDDWFGWLEGRGLFGFNAPAGIYPAPVQTTWTTGYTTYYARAAFDWNYDVTGIALIASTYLSDGAVFYLNGAPAKSLRMPDGEPSYSTPATGGPESPGTAETFSLPVEALAVGHNVLAVEVHQAEATPDELVFGLSLTATDSLAPIIEDPAQPEDRVVVEGESTSFSPGSVVGSPPLTYQWFKDGSPILDATDPTYTIPVVLDSDAGSYSVEITNARDQSTTSRTAELTTTAIPVELVDADLPTDVTIREGETAFFAVSVTGSPLLEYQWHKDGMAIADATAAELTIPNAQIADAGLYSVTVANRLNSVTSREAVLSVQSDQTPPVIVAALGSAQTIQVTFSEPVDDASASLSDNYDVDGGVEVLAAGLDPADARIVVLTTSPQLFGTPYVLRVSGVEDLFGNRANAAASFRSTIAIDGSLDDWAGIPLAWSGPQESDDGLEFKDVYLTNDEEYLYVRFGLYAPVGPLAVDHYYHINIDTDADSASGRALAGIGVEVMIENGAGYQQKEGGFNEGGVGDLDFALGPDTQAVDFECRISRHARYETDSQPVFVGDDITCVLELISSAWSLVHLAPADGFGVPYTFVDRPPLSPGPLQVNRVDGQIEISWPGDGRLESRGSLDDDSSWVTLPDASSPYRVSPTSEQLYFRLSR